MKNPGKPCASLALIAAILFSVSCSTIRLSPPGPENQTLLVLPVQVRSTAVYSDHGFYHVYRIVNAADSSEQHQVILKFPLPDDMEVVDTLPPGDYILRSYTSLPMGSGDITGGYRTHPRNDRFTLEFGKITLFDQSFNVRMWNQDPGRMGYIYFDFEMAPVTAEQRQELLRTLASKSNFDSWKIYRSD